MLNDRYFSPEPRQRGIAHDLYAGARELPLICPHGHVDPRLLADPDYSFGTPVDLLIIPDHYIQDAVLAGYRWKRWVFRARTARW